MDQTIISHTEDKMKKSLEAIRRDLSSIRTGRATPALLDKIVVEAYGAEVPLKQVAGISAPEARLLVIQPFDKSLAASIEKAILKSDLGLTPLVDSGTLRLPIPQLTEDRRKEYVKMAKKKVEDARVALRNIRREGNEGLKELEKKGSASEDDVRRAQEQIQKIMDRHSKELEDVLVAKEKEIMEV